MRSPLTSEMLSGTRRIPAAPQERPEIGKDSGQLACLPLRLLQPKRHVHLAVHGQAGCEMVTRLLTLCGAPIELGKANVAVGGERTHAQFLGQGEGLPLVAYRDV